jgi:hypothetical protein
MDGTPHPTRHQDIAEPANYRGDVFSDDGRFEQTDAVLEKKDVTEEGGVGRQPDQGGTWTEGPRTAISTTDPEKNPIREHLLQEQEEDDGS